MELGARNLPGSRGVDRDSFSCKLWLDPDVIIADNYGYRRRELRDIERIAREHVEELRNAWDKFCTDHAGNT